MSVEHTLGCPLCAAPLPAPTAHCPQCHADIRWQVLQTMQEDLQRSQRLAATLAVQLAQLQERVDHFARLFPTPSPSLPQHNNAATPPQNTCSAPLPVALPAAEPLLSTTAQQRLTLLLPVGVLGLMVLMPLLFSGPWVTMFWTVQATALLWLGMHWQQRWLGVMAVALHGLTLGKFLLHDYDVIFRLHLGTFAYQRGFAHLLVERWGTATMVLVSLLYSARMLRLAAASPEHWQHVVAAACRGLGAVVLLLLLTIEVSAFFAHYVRQARLVAISGLWVFLSMITLLYGFLSQQLLVQRGALGLFALTILKIIFMDMAYVSLSLRVLSLGILGALLAGATYTYYAYCVRPLPCGQEAPDQASVLEP